MNKIVTILTAGLLLLATSVFSQLTFTISPQPISGNVGDMVTVDVTVTNFQNIVSTQYSLAYDPSILQFVSVDNPDAVPGFVASNLNDDPANGTIGATWIDPTVSGANLPDGTKFFTLTFELVGNVGSDTRILFANSPVPLEATDGTGNVITNSTIVFDDGTPGGGIGSGGTGTTGGTTTGGTTGGTTTGGTTGGTTTGGTTGGTTTGGTTGGTTTGGTTGGTTTGGTTGGTTTGGTTGGTTTSGTTGGTTTGGTTPTCSLPASGFALIGSSEMGNVGDIVCVAVSGQDFTNILSMQYSMNWDPAILRFDNVQSLNLGGLNVSNFNLVSPGNLGIAWSDPMAVGLSVAGGSILYEVCFEVLSSGTQEMTFSSNPVPIEVVNSAGNALGNFPNCPATINPGGTTTGGTTTGGTTTGGTTTGGTTTGGTTPTCNLPATGFALMGSAEMGNVGDIVCVAVSGQDFTNILSMQYSMNWDPAILRFDNVQGLNLSGLNGSNFNLISPGNLGIAWSDPMAVGVSVTNGGILYEVCFEVVASGVQEMTFSGSPVPIEVVDGNGNALGSFPNCPATISPPGTTTGGTTTGGTTTGGGMMCTPPSSGFAILGSSEEGAVGDVVCVTITSQDFDNILSMQYSMNWDPAVLQYNTVQGFGLSALGVSNFNLVSPGNLGIAWSDQNAVGISFPDGNTLYEVCFTVLSGGRQELTFTGAPVPIEVVNSSGMVVQFESCPAVIEPGMVQPPPGDLTLIASDQMAPPNGMICIPVTSNGFNNILSMQYSMNWDPAVLTFQGVNIPNPSNLAGLVNTNFSSPSAGNLSVTWFDGDSSGESVTAGDVLYEVCFQVNATATVGSSSSISFSGNPTPIEVKDANLQDVPVNSTPSALTIIQGTNTSAVGGAAVSVNGDPSATICMSIQLNNFTDIIGFQTSLNWDPTVLQYNRTEGYNLPGLSAVDFNITQVNNGMLSLAWLDMTTQGVTLADGTTAFEVCFDLIGAGGTSSVVNFGDSPVPTEVVRAGVGTISLAPTGGTVAVNIIVDPPDPACSRISVQPEIIGSSCFSFNNGEIRLTLGGGDGAYTYSWSGPTTGTLSTSNGVANITGLPPGAYSVTVTSCGGAEVLNSLPVFTITEPSAIMATVQTQDATCTDGGRIVLTASGGNGPYRYSWNSNALVPAEGPLNVSPGTYSLTVIDNSGCSTIINDITVGRTGSSSIAVTQNVTPATCEGRADGQVVLMVNGSVTGLICDWGGNGIFGCTPTNVPAGTYVVAVRDANAGVGCEAMVSITVGNSKVVTATASVTDDICATNEGAILISPNGGMDPYFYQWTGTTAIANTDNPTGLPKGTYDVTLSDADGCAFSIQDITVGGADEPVSVRPTGQSNTDCADDPTGAIAISVAGGTEPYSYQWTNEEGVSIPGDRATSNLPAGIYRVLVTDSRGCIREQSYTIAANSDLRLDTVIVTGLAPTAGATVSVSGGTTDLQYFWCNGQSGPTVENLGAGTCNVMVIDDLGCAVVATFEVGEPSLSGGGVTATNISCTGENDGILTANPSGGRPPYAYSWSNGATSQVIVNVGPANYTVTVTDASGAAAESNFNLTEPLPININLAEMIQPSFGGDNGAITIGISGGTDPYQIAWSNGEMNKTEIPGLSDGEYGVIVTDQNDCTASTTFRLTTEVTPDGCFKSIDVITPNEDGRNDAFRVSCVDVTKGNVLRIFDRWGQMVYEAEGYSCVLGTEADCWKGTNLGDQALPKGGYFWVLEYEDGEGQRQRVRDHVTILRE